MDESNNWGRWGSDDERGALNLLTPEVVLAAAGSVREGKIIQLSLPIKGSTSSPAPTTVPHLKGRPLPQHFMSVDGGDYAAGTKAIGAGLKMADDAIIVTPHGTTTHMDALCHMWSGDQLYNGHPADRVRSYGATRCGIEKAGPVVARGVFFDIPALHGVDYLEADVRITVEDLESCDVEVRPGDVAIVRTGWPLAWYESPEKYWSGQPGLSAEAGRWLAERDVCMVASDNAAISGLNKHQGADESITDDLHMLFLWRHGIYLAEMLWLEDLAKTSRKDFLFLASPLNINGGTGSPINPVAVL